MRTYPDVAQTLNNLAIVYQAQGKYREAEGLFKRALAIREKALGANHPDVGQTLNNLANVYRAQGKYREAEGLLKRALAITRKRTRCEPPRRGPDPQNLAIVYRSQGKYGEAEGLHKRALAIREQVLGANHPDVADALNNLALVYRAQGKYSEAEGALQARVGDQGESSRCEPPRRGARPSTTWPRVSGAGQVQRRRRGSSSARWSSAKKRSVRATPTWARPSNNLAIVYRAQGKYGEAEGLLKRALAIRGKALGANHPDVARHLSST